MATSLSKAKTSLYSRMLGLSRETNYLLFLAAIINATWLRQNGRALYYLHEIIIIATFLTRMALVMKSLLPTITEPTGHPRPYGKVVIISYSKCRYSLPCKEIWRLNLDLQDVRFSKSMQLHPSPLCLPPVYTRLLPV